MQAIRLIMLVGQEVPAEAVVAVAIMVIEQRVQYKGIMVEIPPAPAVEEVEVLVQSAEMVLVMMVELVDKEQI